MNRSIRNLIVAIPLATAALTMTPVAAMATEPGPVIVLPPAQPDPKPLDLANPTPEPTNPDGPDDIAPAPKPTKPKGPGDLAPAPKPDKPKGPGDLANPTPEPTNPDGPGDLTAPEPCPTHGIDCTDGGKDGSDDADGGGTDEVATPTVSHDVSGVEVPSRVHAGLVDVADQSDGSDLAWLLAGGALVTASGVAFVVRRRVRNHA